MKVLKIVSVILLIVILGTYQSIAQCTKDTDCKGDRICVDGECVEPDAEEVTVPEAEETPEPEAEMVPEVEEKPVSGSSMGAFMFYIDPLGGLFFGPHVGFEIGVGPNSFIDVHYRHSAFGLIYDAIATKGFEYYMKMGSGATGAGYKHYLPLSGMPHRFYLGGSFDFGWSGVKKIEEEYPDEDWETSVKLLFIAGHAGWLWRFDSPFNLGIGLIFGVAIETKAEKEYDENYPYTYKEQPETKTYPGGGVQLLLNFEFGKK
jgi:hypothetical protein